MEDTTIVFLALGIGVPVMFAAIIGIILFAGKARPRRVSARGRPDPAASTEPGTHSSSATA